jgi:hypothetical protein
MPRNPPSAISDTSYYGKIAALFNDLVGARWQQLRQHCEVGGFGGLAAFPYAARTAGAQSFQIESIRALHHWWSMIFSENRFPLFRIML